MIGSSFDRTAREEALWRWVQRVARASLAVRTVTANATVLASDGTVLVNASSGAVTITLPSASEAAGFAYRIKKTDASANTVTVQGVGGATIDGAASTSLTSEGETVVVQSDGTNWQIVSGAASSTAPADYLVSASGTFSLAGALTLAIQADTDISSFKYAWATTAWASDAAAYTAAQSGTLVDARNATITLGGPYAVGDTVYVAIAGYTGAAAGGTVSGPFRYAFLNGARDTIPLMGRARVTATTATTVTIRYAVACPVAPSPNTASIAYTAVGTGSVTPASPQTVTPQLGDTVTETAGSYVDFTVTRPSAGAGAGRITFTVTATGRIADTDSVDVPATGLIYALCEAVQTDATATSVTFQVNASASNGTPQVRLNALEGPATQTAGAAAGTLVASGSSWTFSRGGFREGQSQAEFEAVLAGAISDTDLATIPEQGRDTVALTSRARVTATTATTVTVRVAVADPYPQGANSATITLQTQGLGTITQTSGAALPSPITVTPAATLTEAAGTFYDFLVPRPAAGAGIGGVTFTATAANRVSDSDPVYVTPSILVYSLCEAVQTAATATSITVQVNASADNGTPQVRLSALNGTATRTAGATVGTLTASGSSWTFSRGAFQSGPSQAEFESVLAGAVTDVDLIEIPEQGRDTVPLIARARVTASTATDVTVRVAVADPYPQGANSATITYQVLGLTGVTPASSQTVTPAATLTEAASTYVDFTVPRPAAGSPTGRITFTATAANRTSDSDAVDVPAQDLIAPSLKIVTTPAANDYSLVITWDGTIVYDLSGTSQSVSGWTSPRTVTITRNDFLGETKVAAFAVTKNNITVSESINVPPKDNANASITIGTQTADDVTDDYEFSWTTSGFPTGTTYNLTYTTTTTAGVIEQGSLTNQTSPVTVASGFNIGASPKYQMRIDAIKSGTLVLTASRSGTFLT